jgi:hypothetical protein
MLSIKLDDIQGRTKIDESLAKGDRSFEAGVLQSLNVLMKEIQSLCLDFDMHMEHEEVAKRNIWIFEMHPEEGKKFSGFDQDRKFDTITISVGSPDAIRSWLKVEIKNTETINYRTFNS